PACIVKQYRQIDLARSEYGMVGTSHPQIERHRFSQDGLGLLHVAVAAQESAEIRQHVDAVGVLGPEHAPHLFDGAAQQRLGLRCPPLGVQHEAEVVPFEDDARVLLADQVSVDRKCALQQLSGFLVPTDVPEKSRKLVHHERGLRRWTASCMKFEAVTVVALGRLRIALLLREPPEISKRLSRLDGIRPEQPAPDVETLLQPFPRLLELSLLDQGMADLVECLCDVGMRLPVELDERIECSLE